MIDMKENILPFSETLNETKTAYNTKIAAIHFCSATKVFEIRKAKNVKLATRR
jgi:hypothetical protein